MRVAHARRSLRSSLTLTVPSIITKAKGGAWSSTQTHARGSRRSALPLTDVAPVVKTTSVPSTTNHTGTTCGLPSSRVVATLAVRVPSITNARHSSSVMRRMPPPYAESAGHLLCSLARPDVLGAPARELATVDVLDVERAQAREQAVELPAHQRPRRAAGRRGVGRGGEDDQRAARGDERGDLLAGPRVDLGRQRLDGQALDDEVERPAPLVRRVQQVGDQVRDRRAGVARAGQLDGRLG